jgi:dihydropteroate synthase
VKFRFRNKALDVSVPQVMGILNVTPDSFSDGGLFDRPDAALRHAESMIAAGASILDVGGESTRPGATPVSTQEELDRVLPVVRAIATSLDVIVSVDTSNPIVISEAANAGAHLINDVRALRREGALEAAVASGLPVCLMHMKGEPGVMQDQPSYDNVVDEVSGFLLRRVQDVMAAGIPKDQILLDPGFGFGKTFEHNCQLLNRLEQICQLGFPLLTGLSRKRMIAAILNGDEAPEQRDGASAAAAVICAMKGARIVRAHDVKATWEALQVVRATLGEGHV